MTTEERQLLIKDLCARLPYGVIQVFEDNEYPPCAIIGYDGNDFIDEEGWSHGIGEFKSYLRPMSSMTEEEQQKYYDLTHQEDDDIWGKCLFDKMVDFCNENHLDYRGLIEKGLALEAPKDMYKEK